MLWNRRVDSEGSLFFAIQPNNKRHIYCANRSLFSVICFFCHFPQFMLFSQCDLCIAVYLHGRKNRYCWAKNDRRQGPFVGLKLALNTGITGEKAGNNQDFFSFFFVRSIPSRLKAEELQRLDALLPALPPSQVQKSPPQILGASRRMFICFSLVLWDDHQTDQFHVHLLEDCCIYYEHLWTYSSLCLYAWLIESYRSFENVA